MAAPSVSIPANESTLSLEGWKNGSIFDQVNSYYAAYPGNDGDQQLILTILANNLASITFNVSSSLTPSAFTLSETIFDPNAIQFAVSCGYPLSGQYDTLSRALFYVLIVFSLILRRHVWISVAALGTAMTYAAVSAIHLFALISNFDFGSPGHWDRESGKAFMDVDIFGIYPVLTASAIMLTPIMMWSTSVRKHHAQVVIIYWGILIFAALSAALGTIVHAGHRGDFGQNFIPSFATCTRSSECQPLEPFAELSEKYYNRCNCIDFCGTQGPAASMRKGANMVPYLSTAARSKVLTSSYVYLQLINIIVLAFIVLNGCLGVLGSRFSQSEVRNALFRFINADARTLIKVLFEGKREDDWLERFGLEHPDARVTTWKRFRYSFAKGCAACFYLTAALLTVICPAVFVTTVVANELFVQAMPSSEHSDAVGAWGTWVGAGLIVIAAVVDRYHKAWAESVLVVLEAAWRVVKYARNDRPGVHSEDKKWSIRTRIKLFFVEVAAPFIHGWYSTWRALWTGMTNLKFFALWWKDPEGQSRQTKEDMDRAWEDEETKGPGGKPVCWCSMCENDAKKLNPDSNNVNEPILASAIQRIRTRVNRNRGNKYEIVSTGSEAPTLAPRAMEIPKPIPLVTLLPLSPPADAVGQTGLDRDGGRPTSPSPPHSIGGQVSDVKTPDALPRPISPTEAVPIHRPTFPRQSTDQTAGSDAQTPDATSQPPSPAKAVTIPRRALARQSTDQTTGSDQQAPDTPSLPLSPARAVPIPRRSLARQSTDQTTGSDAQAPDAPSHPVSPARAVPIPRRALARQSTDQSVGLGLEEGPSQAPRNNNKVPTIPPASPEEDETPPRPRSTSPDEVSPHRDMPGSSTW